jgi:hypothetical protein
MVALHPGSVWKGDSVHESKCEDGSDEEHASDSVHDSDY